MAIPVNDSMAHLRVTHARPDSRTPSLLKIALVLCNEWSVHLLIAGSACLSAFATRRSCEGILGIRRARATQVRAQTDTPEGSGTAVVLTALALFDVCPICLHKAALQDNGCATLNP